MKNMRNIGEKNKILSPAKMSRWCFSLEHFLSSGISIVDAFRMMEQDTREKEVVRAIRLRVEQGDSLRSAMEKSGCFDPFALAITESGEVSGRLEEAFIKLRNFYGQRETFRKSLMQAMTYPILVLGALLFLMLFILFYFVPSMAELYEQNTAWMLSSSGRVMRSCLFFRQYFVQILFTLSLTILLSVLLVAQIAQRYSDLPVSFHLPIAGELFRKQKMSEILWSLGVMTESGIDILKSIRIAYGSQSHPGIQKRIQGIERDISAGISLKESIRKIAPKEEKLIYFVGLGEDTGDLSGKLKHLSMQYKEEVDGKYQMISSLIQPIVILMMVATVGVLMVGIVFPLLDMNVLYAM